MNTTSSVIPPNSTPKRYRVISLFTGGGGLDLGLERTGSFEVLACVEKVPAFCETLRRNRDAGRLGSPNTRIYQADLHDPASVNPEQILSDLGLQPGEIDLVVGGPPCQTFSTTGKRETVQDPRGTLLWRFLHFVDRLKPKVFVMENVRGLMSAALCHRPIAQRPEKGGLPLKPDEEPGSVLRLFLNDLHNSYRMDCFEVNAVNYGAPQLRERVLFIGNRFNQVFEFPAPTHGGPTPQELPIPEPAMMELPLDDLCPAEPVAAELAPYRTLRQALVGLKDECPTIMDFSPRKKKYLSMVPAGGNWRCLPAEVAKEAMGKAYIAKGGRSGWWRRLTFDLPSPTILTMPNHAGTALCHPSETRALTLRECARVQEFPDDWEFVGKAPEQYAQVGNAVPVRLGVVCGEMIAKELGKIGSLGLSPAPGDHSPFRIVYVKSHIRTRRWFKAGENFVWQDGEENGGVAYNPAKTHHKVTVPVRL